MAEKRKKTKDPNDVEKSIDLTMRSYDEITEAFHKHYYGGEDAKGTASVKLGLVTFIKRLSRDGVILDIGCGPGGHLDFFRRATTCKVVGIDLSMGMLRYAKQHLPEANLARMDVRKLGFVDSTCDGIWASCLVHHLPKKQIRDFFRELYRIAKSGCIVYIITNRGSFQNLFDRQNKPFPVGPRLSTALLEDEIVEMVEDSGFTVLSTKVSKEDLIHLISKKSATP